MEKSRKHILAELKARLGVLSERKTHLIAALSAAHVSPENRQSARAEADTASKELHEIQEKLAELGAGQ